MKRPTKKYLVHVVRHVRQVTTIGCEAISAQDAMTKALERARFDSAMTPLSWHTRGVVLDPAPAGTLMDVEEL